MENDTFKDWKMNMKHINMVAHNAEIDIIGLWAVDIEMLW